MLTEKNFLVKLKTKEPLRVGGQKDPLSGSDNPVTKVGSKLVIPGSSLKGALRNELETYLIDNYYRSGKWDDQFKYSQPCIPGAELSKDEEKLVAMGKYRNQNGSCHYPCTERHCKKENHSICPVCYLLGCMGLYGFVKVPFLYAETATTELYSSRIDRGTKTVVHGTNRPYELVPDDTFFQGMLSVLIEDSILNSKLGEPRKLGESRTTGDKWLEGKKIDTASQENFINTYIVERLQNIKVIGGYKSKGFGAVEISVTAM